MLETLLKLSGLWTAGSEKLVGIKAARVTMMHPSILIVAGILLTAGIVWLYFREQGELSVAGRIIAAGCRILLVSALLLILADPIVSVTTSLSVSQSLVVLIDNSSSMRIADVRDLPEDQKRQAIAQGRLDAKGGLQQELPAGSFPAVSRIDLVKSAIANLHLPEQLAKQFQISTYMFDRQVTDAGVRSGDEQKGNPAGWADNVEANGSATALGDGVQHILVTKRGEALGGILVISDGQSNAGLSLEASAKLARDEHVPVYCYGVGTTSPKDVQVSAILVPDVAFIRNDLPVTVRMRAEGYKGQQAKVILKLDGATVATSDVLIDQDGERTVSMTFSPEKTGSFALAASVEPLPGEVVTDNNTSPPKQVRIVDTRIKVLHIEQSPRWEFKYLQAMLLRDPRIEYHCWLMEADANSAEGASPYVHEFPTVPELRTYDVVIFGDVEPGKLPAGAMDALNNFVAKDGGGFIMIAGLRGSPLAYRRTPIDRMLPVDFDSTSLIAQAGDTERPIQLELTPAGMANTMLRLADTEADNSAKWRTLPSLYWTAHVSGAKPAAEVLAVDPDPAKATRLGKMPVIALQQYGMGSVLYVGTDNTWRWRKNDDVDVFNKIWGQIVDRMAMSHLLGAANRTQLSLDRVTYAPGDRAIVYGRLSRPGSIDPLTQPTVDAYFTTATAGDRQSFQLRALPDQPGIYRGEFIAPLQGHFQVKADSAPLAAVDFFVVDTQIEHGSVSLNETGLRDLAQRTGGAFVREEDLYRLPELMRHDSQPILYTREVEIWSSPLFFIIPLLLATVEWWIRKKALLK